MEFPSDSQSSSGSCVGACGCEFAGVLKLKTYNALGVELPSDSQSSSRDLFKFGLSISVVAI